MDELDHTFHAALAAVSKTSSRMVEQKKYELAYLLSPAIAEEEVLTWSGKIAKIIEDSKGLVRHQEIPKKRRLTYLINKEGTAYFGWVTFSMASDLVASLDKKLKMAENTLRHMIVEEVEIPVQPLRIFAPRPAPVPQRPRPGITPPAPAEAAKQPEEKLDLEELDKKLEEILGK